MESRKKRIIVIIAVALVVCAIGFALVVPSCSNTENHDSGVVGIISTIADRSINVETEAESAGEHQKLSSQGESNKTAMTSGDGVNGGGACGNSDGSDSSSNSDAPQKRWVADYTTTWVEDSPAWDEQIPIYDQVEISVCNICGASITGYEASHAKAHMLAGEGSGHHGEVVFNVVGYDAIHHDATGHYETVEDGGHWE